MPSAEWGITHLGLSSDGRTNRWRITPPCGHKPFEPMTTMFADQHVQCPVCDLGAHINYNERKVIHAGS